MTPRLDDPLIAIGCGERRGELRPLHLPLSSLLTHTLLTGTSGWGKSFAMAGLLCSIARQNTEPLRIKTRTNTVLLDAKHDLAPLLRDILLPAMHRRFGYPDPGTILSIDPFGPYTVKMNPLTPIQGMEPGVQAHLVASVVCTLTSGVGPRMTTILMQLALAEISLAAAGERPSLANIRRMMVNEAFRRARGARITDPNIQRYVLVEFERESKSSIEALTSRITWLMAVAAVDAMLNSDGCISGSDIIEAPIAICDTGNAPHGLESLGHLILTWIMLLLQHGVFGRDVTENTPHTVLACDEWQRAAALAPESFERLLSLARFKRISCMLANQSLAQVRAASPVLLESLKTNIVLQYAFRPDANAGDLDHVLPMLTTGRCVDPGCPDRVLTESEERGLVIRQLSELPKRWALFANRLQGRTGIVRSMGINLEKARASAAELPEATLHQFARGRLGVPRDELIASREPEPVATTERTETPRRSTRKLKLVLPP